MKTVRKILHRILPFLARKKRIIIKPSPHSVAEAHEHVYKSIKVWSGYLNELRQKKKLSHILKKSITDTIAKIELAKASKLSRRTLQELAKLAQQFQKLLTPPHQPD